VRQLPKVNKFLQDLSARERLKTRVDADGTLIAPGKLGHIYEYDDQHLAVMVVPSTPRRNYWGVTRAKLVRLGFVVVQDGDCEGAACFDPSNAEQAKAAIRAAGVRRKRRLSPAQIERQVSWLRTAAEGHFEPQNAFRRGK